MCAAELLVEFCVGVAERTLEDYANVGLDSGPVLLNLFILFPADRVGILQWHCGKNSALNGRLPA